MSTMCYMYSIYDALEDRQDESPARERSGT